MTIKIIALAATGLLIAGTAVAQDNRLDPRADRNNLTSETRTSVQGNLSENRVLGSYRVVTQNANDGDRLSGGVQVYNEATRTMGTVSGNLTVLAKEGNLSSVAQQFGLRIVNQDSRTGLGQLAVPENVDMQQLVEEIKASGLVRAARIELIEPRNELHVISR